MAKIFEEVYHQLVNIGFKGKPLGQAVAYIMGLVDEKKETHDFLSVDLIKSEEGPKIKALHFTPKE